MAMKQIHAEQKQSPNETSIYWKTLFPLDITTIIGSKTFIKQLTALILSCVTHIRGIYPDYAFESRRLDDRNLKILNACCDCKNAYLMTRWIKSSFKAIDLQYMQTITLEILTLDDQPLEYYAIDYTYDNEESSCTLYANKEKESGIHFTNKDVENSTKKLVFALMEATEGLGDLPANYNLQLRIHYYDDRTPASFTPEYFTNAETYDWDKVNNFKRIRFGTVKTTFHSLTLRSGSTLVPSDGSDQPLFNYPIENKETSSEEYQSYRNISRWQSWYSGNEEIQIPSSLNSIKDDEMEVDERNKNECDDDENEFIPLSPLVSNGQTISNQYLSNSTVSVSTADEQTESDHKEQHTTDNTTAAEIGDDSIEIKCLCSYTQGSDIFKCKHCGYGHHLICYRFWPNSTTESDMYCYLCSKDKCNNLICADSYFMNCSQKQIKNLMLFRQFLHKSQDIKKVSVKAIVNEYNLCESLAKKFIKKFLDEKLIKPSLKKDVYTVHSTKIKQFLNSYFHY